MTEISRQYSKSDLNLKQLYYIHAGDESFQLSRKERAVAASRILEDIRPL